MRDQVEQKLQELREQLEQMRRDIVAIDGAIQFAEFLLAPKLTVVNKPEVVDGP